MIPKTEAYLDRKHTMEHYPWPVSLEPGPQHHLDRTQSKRQPTIQSSALDFPSRDAPGSSVDPVTVSWSLTRNHLSVWVDVKKVFLRKGTSANRLGFAKQEVDRKS